MSREKTRESLRKGVVRPQLSTQTSVSHLSVMPRSPPAHTTLHRIKTHPAARRGQWRTRAPPPGGSLQPCTLLADVVFSLNCLVSIVEKKVCMSKIPVPRAKTRVGELVMRNLRCERHRLFPEFCGEKYYSALKSIMEMAFVDSVIAVEGSLRCQLRIHFRICLSSNI